jgi:hypothetical protein
MKILKKQMELQSDLNTIETWVMNAFIFLFSAILSLIISGAIVYFTLGMLVSFSFAIPLFFISLYTGALSAKYMQRKYFYMFIISISAFITCCAFDSGYFLE